MFPTETSTAEESGSLPGKSSDDRYEYLTSHMDVSLVRTAASEQVDGIRMRKLVSKLLLDAEGSHVLYRQSRKVEDPKAGSDT